MKCKICGENIVKVAKHSTTFYFECVATIMGDKQMQIDILNLIDRVVTNEAEIRCMSWYRDRSIAHFCGYIWDEEKKDIVEKSEEEMIVEIRGGRT